MSKRPVIARARSARSNLPATQDFLLEIGCEELPADYMPNVLSWRQQGGLAESAAAALEKHGIPWTELRNYGTPRRLVLVIRGIPAVVERTEEGPPAQVAFDAQGKPTRAAEAFAQKHGVPVTKLIRKQSAKGERLAIDRIIPSVHLLEAAVPEMISGISFPKTMRWDDSGVRFARPIRWLLAFYGSSVVRCAFGNTKAGKTTFGMRRSGLKPVLVPRADAYFGVLKNLGIQLEEGRGFLRAEGGLQPLKLKTPKRDELLKRLASAAKALKGRLPEEGTEEFEWLLDTAAFLAEDPVVQAGSFRPEYLDLPPEVLATSMAKHLKLFSVYSPDGSALLPKFLGVLEGKPSRPEAVMANIERILEARFTDARFFYREDTKTPLAQKVPLLEKVVFHEKLGTVGEKTPRLEQLMMALARHVKSAPGVNPDVLTREIRRVAELAKADLVTQMVREFPSLQGTIGACYARAGGEPEAVARGIAEQYRPRAAADPVPATLQGALLALADRLDTLIGYFGVGLSPTGSADPYGLRRQALGVVRIILSPPPGVSFVGLSIDTLCDVGLQSWGARLSVDAKRLKAQLRAFFRERFEWLAGKGGEGEREMVAAVLMAGDDDLAGAAERLKVLRGFWANGKDGRRRMLEQAAKVAERTARIVKSVKDTPLPDRVDAGVLSDPMEKELWAAWSRVSPQLKEQISRREYEEATRTYSTLYPAVHAFFDKVFVMDENLDLRRNRLALLREIHRGLADGFADLSQLPIKEQ